ncbi:MAG: GatB/YqeY domain-containing protein [Myxococcales bacterium]|nr:GatB/YqeY domain-containing protein [Myxococcales bacterium]
MSTLVETIKAQIKVAMKAKDDLTKNILRVALGEIQKAEYTGDGDITDEAGHKIIRKIIASNEATIEASPSDETKADLAKENVVLLALVPTQLSVSQIAEALVPIQEALKSAPSDGPAMGMAMKHLKSVGAAVDGDSVRAALSQIRSK